jgi:hypothetical protein
MASRLEEPNSNPVNADISADRNAASRIRSSHLALLGKNIKSMNRIGSGTSYFSIWSSIRGLPIFVGSERNPGRSKFSAWESLFGKNRIVDAELVTN